MVIYVIHHAESMREAKTIVSVDLLDAESLSRLHLIRQQ